MEDLCVICFEAMDMRSYNAEGEHTETCYKLECGHAYHTACIIRCLSLSNQKCPNCNQNKSPAEQLTREGVAKRCIAEIKKEPEVRLLITELRQIVSEYRDSMDTLKEEVKAFSKKRKEELLIDEKRKYMMNCITRIITAAKAVSKTKGPQYLASLNTTATGGRYWRGTTFERIFFGINEAYKIHRLKSPSLYVRI